MGVEVGTKVGLAKDQPFYGIFLTLPIQYVT